MITKQKKNKLKLKSGIFKCPAGALNLARWAVLPDVRFVFLYFLFFTDLLRAINDNLR